MVAETVKYDIFLMNIFKRKFLVKGGLTYMGKEDSKKNLKMNGKRFKEMSEENMQSIQGSGAIESSNVSEHTFAAKVLMKGGNCSGQ